MSLIFSLYFLNSRNVIYRATGKTHLHMPHTLYVHYAFLLFIQAHVLESEDVSNFIKIEIIVMCFPLPACV